MSIKILKRNVLEEDSPSFAQILCFKNGFAIEWCRCLEQNHISWWSETCLCNPLVWNPSKVKGTNLKLPWTMLKLYISSTYISEKRTRKYLWLSENTSIFAISVSLWYQSFLNPNASSADDTMPKSLMKHFSTTFVTAKTYNISLQQSLNKTDLPLVAICWTT